MTGEQYVAHDNSAPRLRLRLLQVKSRSFTYDVIVFDPAP